MEIKLMERQLCGVIHTYIDESGRLYIPSDVYEAIGEGPLAAITLSDRWGSYISMYRSRRAAPKEHQDAIVELPIQHRMIRIRTELREASGLSMPECTIMGARDHIELWGKECQKEEVSRGTSKP